MIHSYPWYPQDWRGSETRMRLTLAERSIYRDLLDHCWEQGSLPTDERVLAGIAGATVKEFKQCWPAVSTKFEERDGRFYNSKVDEKRPELERWHEQKRNAGLKSGETRRKKNADKKGTEVERTLNGRSNGNLVLLEPVEPSASVVSSSLRSELATAATREALFADGPDPTQLVRDALEECANVWPNVGDKENAIPIWEREAAKDTQGVAAWCAKIVRTCKLHAPKQRAKRESDKHHFIPHLSRWVKSRDYTHPPPEVIETYHGPRDLGEDFGLGVKTNGM